jgi:hypothetical protein
MPNSPSPIEVQSWLEWGGERLLSLNVFGTKPSGYRSFWPDYPDDPHTAYGYTGETFRAPLPGANEISLMDEVLNLVLLIPNTHRRRIVNCRILIKPINGRHIYSWAKISAEVGSNPGMVKYQFKMGLINIVNNISEPKTVFIRSYFSSGPSRSP